MINLIFFLMRVVGFSFIILTIRFLFKDSQVLWYKNDSLKSQYIFLTLSVFEILGLHKLDDRARSENSNQLNADLSEWGFVIGSRQWLLQTVTYHYIFKQLCTLYIHGKLRSALWLLQAHMQIKLLSLSSLIIIFPAMPDWFWFFYNW